MRTVTVSAPLCSPYRSNMIGVVRDQLAPYQFRLGGVDAEIQKEGGKDVCWWIRVAFTDQAAEWGEYVLLRHGYSRVGPCLNAKNQGWADKHLVRPEGAWYGPGCKDRPKGTPPGLPNANPPPAWRDQPQPAKVARKAQSRKRPARRPATSRQTVSRARRLWWRIVDAL